MRKSGLFILILFLFSFGLTAQKNDTEKALQTVIDQLFSGMLAGDGLAIEPLFTPGATLSSIATNREGEVVKQGAPIDKFIASIGKTKPGVLNEKIWSYDFKVDEPMAIVWTEYSFYLEDKLSHCGVNVFEMIHLADGWKISSITDTRRKTNCMSEDESEINALVDGWHLAAAVADEDTFFGSMTPKGIYIGTDASERWEADEMKVWSKKYFEQESAWAFTAHDRNIKIAADGQTAWFDELLDTWMGDCRGSGIVIKTATGWKIDHYHLSIAVPNDKVDGYLNLIGKPRKK